MKKIEAIARAKTFLTKYISDLMGYDEEAFYEDFPSSYLFDNPGKPYYVYLDAENYGCFTSQSFFLSKKEVEELIEAQLESDHREHWDRVIIFSIKKNKVVKPKIVL